MISPSIGFSLAVSGMMIPPLVFSSSCTRLTITRSCRGRIFMADFSPCFDGLHHRYHPRSPGDGAGPPQKTERVYRLEIERNGPRRDRLPLALDHRAEPPRCYPKRRCLETTF